MLENRMVKVDLGGWTEEVRISRIVASWNNAVGPYYGRTFQRWCMSLGIEESVAREIEEFASCGKFELERNAEKFSK